MDWEMPGRQPRDADFDDAFNATSFLTADSGVSMGTGPPVSTSSADSGLASDGLRMATASVPEPTPTALIPSPARHQPTAEPGARSASHPGSVASEDVYRSEAVYSTALAGEASRFFAGQSTSSESGQQSIFSPAAVPTTLPAPTPSSSFAPDSSPQPAVEPTVLTTANISLINPKGVYRIDVDAAGDLVLFNSSHPAIHDAVDLTLTDSHIESNGSLTLFDRLDRLDRPRSMPTRVRIENSTLTAGDNLVLFNDKMMRGNMALEIAKTSHLVAQKGYVALIEAPSGAQDKSDHPVVLNISIQESAMNAPQGGVFAVPGVVASGAPRSLVVSINSSNLTAGNGPNQFAGAMKSENQQVPLYMHFAIHNSRLEAEKGFVHVISAAICNTRAQLDVSGSHFSARNGAETALIGRIAEDGNQLDLSMKDSSLSVATSSDNLESYEEQVIAAPVGKLCGGNNRINLHHCSGNRVRAEMTAGEEEKAKVLASLGWGELVHFSVDGGKPPRYNRLEQSALCNNSVQARVRGPEGASSHPASAAQEGTAYASLAGVVMSSKGDQTLNQTHLENNTVTAGVSRQKEGAGVAALGFVRDGAQKGGELHIHQAHCTGNRITAIARPAGTGMAVAGLALAEDCRSGSSVTGVASCLSTARSDSPAPVTLTQSDMADNRLTVEGDSQPPIRQLPGQTQPLLLSVEDARHGPLFVSGSGAVDCGSRSSGDGVNSTDCDLVACGGADCALQGQSAAACPVTLEAFAQSGFAAGVSPDPSCAAGGNNTRQARQLCPLAQEEVHSVAAADGQWRLAIRQFLPEGYREQAHELLQVVTLCRPELPKLITLQPVFARPDKLYVRARIEPEGFTVENSRTLLSTEDRLYQAYQFVAEADVGDETAPRRLALIAFPAGSATGSEASRRSDWILPPASQLMLLSEEERSDGTRGVDVWIGQGDRVKRWSLTDLVDQNSSAAGLLDNVPASHTYSLDLPEGGSLSALARQGNWLYSLYSGADGALCQRRISPLSPDAQVEDPQEGSLWASRGTFSLYMVVGSHGLYLISDEGFWVDGAGTPLMLYGGPGGETEGCSVWHSEFLPSPELKDCALPASAAPEPLITVLLGTGGVLVPLICTAVTTGICLSTCYHKWKKRKARAEEHDRVLAAIAAIEQRAQEKAACAEHSTTSPGHRPGTTHAYALVDREPYEEGPRYEDIEGWTGPAQEWDAATGQSCGAVQQTAAPRYVNIGGRLPPPQKPPPPPPDSPGAAALQEEPEYASVYDVLPMVQLHTPSQAATAGGGPAAVVETELASPAGRPEQRRPEVVSREKSLAPDEQRTARRPGSA